MPKPDGKRTQLSETAGRANILMFTLLRRSKVMRTRTQVSQWQKELQLPPTRRQRLAAGAGAEACGPKLVLHFAQADRRGHLRGLRVTYAIEVPCRWDLSKFSQGLPGKPRYL